MIISGSTLFKMIISHRPLPTTRRWLRAVLVLFAAVLLPLGLAHADGPDFDAVAARLVEAVKAGELTEEQAEAMMGELGRAAFAERMDRARRHRGSDAEFRLKLGKAIRAGKISEGDARRKWEAYEKGKAARAKKPNEAEMAEVKKKIWAAVKEGHVTEEQAKARWEGYLDQYRRSKPDAKGDDARLAKYRAFERSLHEAVAAGKISREDADKKLIEARMRIWPPSKKTDPRDAKVKKRLAEAVKAGTITEEAAKARWAGYLKQKSTQAEQPMPPREEMLEARRKIGAAVEAGAITEEEARAKWEAYLEAFRKSAAKRRR